METSNGSRVAGAVIAPKASDEINHPAHYTAGSIEVIDFLESGWEFPFHLANAIKYICRAGRKDKNALVTDLKKAVWYINRYIEYLGKQEGKA